jgi:hypothetical protein
MLQTVGYAGIVRNIPFIFYCAGLALIYITLNHYAENTIRKINETSKQMKELRWKYIDTKSQMMFLTKESELAKKATEQGLEVLKTPPQKITIIQQIKHAD